MIFGSHVLHECVIETVDTVIKLHREVVKLNSERKVQITESFFLA